MNQPLPPCPDPQHVGPGYAHHWHSPSGMVWVHHVQHETDDFSRCYSAHVPDRATFRDAATGQYMAELRRLAEALREYAELDPDCTDPHDLANERLAAILALGGEWASVLGLLDRLAHMTEARDNARAEVERLAVVVRRVRELHRESRSSLSALYPNPICECGKDYPCPTIRALGGE